MPPTLSPEQQAEIAHWSAEEKRLASAAQKALTFLQRATKNDTLTAIMLMGSMVDGTINMLPDTQTRQKVALWFIRKLAAKHDLLGPLN